MSRDTILVSLVREKQENRIIFLMIQYFPIGYPGWFIFALVETTGEVVNN
ncbi:MAG: hypothetical protein AB7W47_11500 [Calditrichaceae bacterium]